MPSKLQVAFAVLLAAAIALIVCLPHRALEVIDNLLAFSNLGLFLFAAAALLWFLYRVILRKILRARRIANARMRRMIEEAGQRGAEQGSS
ncbi:MAG: hypothetical protein JO249_03100 [Acidobacteria bacterium]|nr:hypothetical protein [Acidobacteriota bacterium]